VLRKAKYVWNQIPLFRFVWPFVAGIILAIFRPDFCALITAMAVAILLAISYFLFHKQHPRSSAVLMSVVFLLGYVHTALLTDRLFDNHYSKLHSSGTMTTFLGEIVSDPIQRTKSLKAEVSLIQIADSGSLIPTNGKILLYLESDLLTELLKQGDILVFNTRLKPIAAPQNPAEFNYQRYMHFHQISHQAYASSGNWKCVKVGDGILRHAHRLQKGIMKVLKERGINDRELAIVSALLVGYKHHLSTDQVSAFASAGAMHVLAVSGLHVGIIFLILNVLFKPLLRLRFGKYAKAIILLLALWSYVAITGLSPSVTRACTMFSFVIIAQLIHRHTSIFNTIATSAVFLLILNPFYIVEVGFQLSYLAVLGIVLIQPRIYELWKPKFWLVQKVWAITAVSLAAQLATFPLGLLYFHQFPNYFLLSNLVVIPAATIILTAGIALVAFQWIPIVSAWLGYFLYTVVHGLDLFIAWVERLPMALIQGVDIGIAETYLLYFLVCTITLFIISKRYYWLPMTLVVLCCIEAVNVYEVFSQRNQSKMIIYSVRGHFALDFIKGTNHVFKVDTVLLNDFDKMRFHIHHNWWKHDLNSPMDSIPRLKEYDNLYLFNGNTLLVLMDSTEIMENLKVDYLLVQEQTVQHPIELLNKVDVGMVVLSQNLNWKTMNYWENTLENAGVAHWNMRDAGAFVVEF